MGSRNGKTKHIVPNGLLSRESSKKLNLCKTKWNTYLQYLRVNTRCRHGAVALPMEALCVIRSLYHSRCNGATTVITQKCIRIDLHSYSIWHGGGTERKGAKGNIGREDLDQLKVEQPFIEQNTLFQQFIVLDKKWIHFCYSILIPDTHTHIHMPSSPVSTTG